MDKKVLLPVGVEDFEDIRKDDYYYVDKTKLIEQLFDNRGKVNLITRPRRFGKTLNMSMLKYFFEIGTDTSLFDGLYITNNKSLCDKHMGKYPVVFLTLKDVGGFTFEEAKYQIIELVAKETERFDFLKDSENLNQRDKEKYNDLINYSSGKYLMNDEMLNISLQLLSELLSKHYNKKTIILIDEYDVPLDKAYNNGYYSEMVSLIRTLFGRALKTNKSLEFAVLTGCLRVSKESIFTGLNNFKILSITDNRFDEQFGFTDDEVKKLLTFYHLEDKFNETKEWYDGYHFGNADIYCPWDVINYVDSVKANPTNKPETYWINTSGNALIKKFIDKATKTTRDEIESLMFGKAIEKQLRLDLTYNEIDNSIENLWSVLFTTGYLTTIGQNEDGAYKLVIPNKEIRKAFELNIKEWFSESVLSDTEQIKNFWKAFEEGKTEDVENFIIKTLSNSISAFDTKARNEEKESSYHNLLVGMLLGNGNWAVKSNVEAGEGFADIIIETTDPNAGIIVELKYEKEFSNMDKACEKALNQIKDRRYQEYLLNEERKDILLYGIAFCKKRCKVVAEKHMNN